MFQRQSLARIARIAGVTTVCTLLVTPGLATIHARQAEQENVMSADVDDQEIEQFTRAFNDVLALIEALQKTLESTQDPEAAQTIKQSANLAMVKAIRSQDIDVERYNLIHDRLPRMKS